jgi:hypothetical protein
MHRNEPPQVSCSPRCAGNRITLAVWLEFVGPIGFDSAGALQIGARIGGRVARHGHYGLKNGHEGSRARGQRSQDDLYSLFTPKC